MTLDQNKSVARRMLEWWVTGDVSVIDETNAPDFVLHASGGRETKGRDAYKELLSSFIGIFSDRRLTIDDVVADGDRVAIRYSWQAVHTGELQGIVPTNRQVTSATVAIYCIANGRIAEEWERTRHAWPHAATWCAMNDPTTEARRA